MNHVKCEEQKKLAQKAAELGVELFVVDDGWFGTRTDDTKGLGDWYVDPGKFPGGLSELISHVKGLGMRFGIWIEPEMVNPDSELYRNHPDWVYCFKNREILEGRNQYVPDLTREEVVRFLIETLDRLLSNYEISYIKWDMNRGIAETGVYGETSVERKQMWLRHMQNFYRVAEEVRKRHPGVEFEACAAGGRVDLGAMKSGNACGLRFRRDQLGPYAAFYGGVEGKRFSMPHQKPLQGSKDAIRVITLPSCAVQIWNG